MWNGFDLGKNPNKGEKIQINIIKSLYKETYVKLFRRNNLRNDRKY